jgi:glutamate/tyrosine decarboxylase-like PLP-dependent enzyme
MTRDKRIELSREEMKDLGYRVVDMIVDHVETLSKKPVSRSLGEGWSGDVDIEPIPEEGGDIAEILRTVERDVLGAIMHVDHPRYFAFIPGPGNFVGAMADALSSGFNVFASTWLEGSGAAQIELVTINWLRQICGMPEGAGGLFVSGGSMANLTGLAVARSTILGHDLTDGVVYFSDQTHSSVERALWVLGFAPRQIRKLPTDKDYRLVPELLSAEIERDRAAGRRPFCVVANAGTTNTGAVDPLKELAAITRDCGMWLHVDGAYGAAAILTEEGKAALSGLSCSDSLVIDPHKWLFCPFEIGCVLVRDRTLLRNAFHILPEYMEDAERTGTEVNFCDFGIQLSRGFRALKLWMSIKVFGLGAFREAVAAGIENARIAETIIGASRRWRVVTPAQLGIVTFRALLPGRPSEEIDSIHRGIVDRLVKDGYAFLSSTVLSGRVVLRMCTINPRTTQQDIADTIGLLERLLAESTS